MLRQKVHTLTHTLTHTHTHTYPINIPYRQIIRSTLLINPPFQSTLLTQPHTHPTPSTQQPTATDGLEQLVPTLVQHTPYTNTSFNTLYDTHPNLSS